MKNEHRVYFPALDGLRAVAFLSVYFQHYVHFALVSFPEEHRPLWLSSLLDSGRYGVPLFFALSSFLVTKLLTIEKERNGTVDVRAFIIRRSLRIWPLYYLFVLAFIARAVPNASSPETWLPPHHPDALNGVSYLLFMGDIRHMLDPASVVSHLWSLGVEEKFYLLWPFAIKLLETGQIRRLCLSLVVFAWLYRLLLAGHVDWLFLWFGPLGHVDSFALGALLALAPTTAFARLRKMPAWTVLGGALLFIWGLTAVEFGINPVIEQRGHVFAIVFGLANVACAVLLARFVKVEGGWAASLPARELGKRSYGAYLLHVPMLTMLLPKFGLPISSPSGGLLAFAGTLTLAWGSYRFIESPFLRLKRRFEKVASRPV